MRKKKTSRRRRSAAEWSKLVAAWKRSGQSAEQFALARGIQPRTLEWWRWQLTRRRKQRQRTKTPASKPRLVAVELQPDRSDALPARGWELEDPRGLVLRGHGPLAADQLRQILNALTSTPTSA